MGKMVDMAEYIEKFNQENVVERRKAIADFIQVILFDLGKRAI